MVSQSASHLNESYPILKLTNITRAFPGVVANDNVSLEINKSEIIAILGENGAGKSTLMKILSGIHQPDAGKIELNLDWFLKKQTEETDLITFQVSNPRKAIQIGIGMVYQHFKLVETMSVRDNIMLGKEFTIKGTSILNYKLADGEIKKLGEQYSMPIDPQAIIEEMPVGFRQRVEILKQLFREAQLLILDEPTAVLTPSEVEELFITIKELKKSGKSIIFISHKLKESLAIADRIIVMRNGKIIGETDPANATEASLAEMMVGRRVLLQLERRDVQPGNPILEINNLTIKDIHLHETSIKTADKIDRNVVKNASFQVRENEIVGIAGVQGNGQTELIEALMGLRRDLTGSIKYYPEKGSSINDELVGTSTLKILEKGIAYIPEDRSTQGLIKEFPVYENTWLGLQTKPERAEKYLSQNESVQIEESKKETEVPNQRTNVIMSLFRSIGKFFHKIATLPITLMKSFANKVVHDFDVMTPNIYVALKNLSGGNQQKVILGREFAKNPRLIIASQPTRGVDIGVTEKVRNALLKMRDEGTGVLLVSSDLDEVLSLSDYILVLYEGIIVGQGNIKDITTQEISQLMTGAVSKSTSQSTIN
ncbi:MAG: ABC transporter ATP-binding protein [Candidatus Hodarchaeales archaeon]|jgi:simple sugar transport system ATP-binding protein